MRIRAKVPTCDTWPLDATDRRRMVLVRMEEEEILYKNTLYDLAIIAEHKKQNGNLVCPRCEKEYHMIDFDEDEAELRQEADHGPYECWQTHLEMGFCEAGVEQDPKEADTNDGVPS